MNPITIDGGRGEGGGQIVRTSLALACITGRPLRMINVRAGRPKPGLANQHLTAIRAAQQISTAEVTGASLGSKQFTFEPGPVEPGEYSFDVGTAGSTTLVLQTIALPLAFTSGNSTVTIIGGTHNPMAPCYEYLESVWAPLLALTGIHIYLQIKRAGFYPAGGGKIEATIVGVGSAEKLQPVTIEDRGEIYSIDGFSAVARLPLSIAERQAKQAELRLSAAGLTHHPINCQSIDAASPGTVLFLNCRCRGAPAAFFSLGARGKPAERVADDAVDQLLNHLSNHGALDPHAADQFVLPLALAFGRSSFTTAKVTDHLVTHVELLRQFLDRKIKLTGRGGEPGTVAIYSARKEPRSVNMDPRYRIADTSQIISPGLVLFKELITANLQRMLEIAGGPERLRPHVKTHKMREIVAMQMAAGITKFKCATIAEAEMVASCGANDVLIAYQLVGPNQPRLVRLMRKFPTCEFGVLVDHPAATHSLSHVVSAAGLTASIWLDIDVGQHRTGIPVGDDAATLFELVSQLPGLRAAGFHVYDGHNHQPTPEEREAAVKSQFAEVIGFKQELERRGLRVPRVVCGGTPTFPIYAKIGGVELSPGTCIFNDNGYGSRFPEMGFERAALLLTRVVSRTAPDRVCLDLGYKAVASDPKGDRLVLLDLPGAKLVLQNEEHLLVETPDAARFDPGDELLACPTHICPTCALHKEAYVVEDGQVVDRWSVVARDRWLDV